MPASPQVLLLEDNPADRDFMAECLAEASPGPALSWSGRLSDARAKLRSRPYQMVVADLNLPDTEGLDTFLRVQEAAPDAAIVVMTGLDDAALASRAVQAGAQDYLVKGELSPERVGRRLAHALERHLRRRQDAAQVQRLRRENTGLRRLSGLDPLTELYNRRGFGEELARSAPAGGSVLLADLDGFKAVNDLFGYRRGDAALLAVARELRAFLAGTGAFAARVGGDEFLAFFPGMRLEDCARLAEDLRARVGGSGVDAPGGGFGVTVSIGVAAAGPGRTALEDLLEATQDALRRGKAGGKNRVWVHRADGDAEERGAVVCRPFYGLSDGRVAGHEFLADAPGAERRDEGRSRERLGRLFSAALRRGRDLECHVHLEHADLLCLRPNEMAALLPSGLDPRRLRLSVPPAPISPLPAGLVEAARAYQSAGWILAVRDLDLGAHGLANLVELAPALVALKPEWVGGASGSPEGLRRLVRAQRALGALGAYVLAAGIASGADVEMLSGLGIPLGRGPLWEGDPR